MNNDEALKSVKTIELIIELMYGGESKFLPALQSFEPISPKVLCAILTSRHGISLGEEFDLWYQWFLGEQSPGTTEEKETLRELRMFQEKTDALFKQARKAQDSDLDK